MKDKFSIGERYAREGKLLSRMPELVTILEPAKTRMLNHECAACGKKLPPKHWICCNYKCMCYFVKHYKVVREVSELRMEVLLRDDFTCKGCEIKLDKKELVHDHILPIALGGDQWDIDNCQTLCKDCHKKKTRDDMQEMVHLKRLYRTTEPPKPKKKSEFYE